MVTKKEVLEFIELQKRANPKLMEQVYTRGGCYSFYLILTNRFPGETKPYKAGLYKHSVEHIVTKIGDHYFDIKGEFTLEKDGEYLFLSELSEKEEKIAKKFKY